MLSQDSDARQTQAANRPSPTPFSVEEQIALSIIGALGLYGYLDKRQLTGDSNGLFDLLQVLKVTVGDAIRLHRDNIQEVWRDRS